MTFLIGRFKFPCFIQEWSTHDSPSNHRYFTSKSIVPGTNFLYLNTLSILHYRTIKYHMHIVMVSNSLFLIIVFWITVYRFECFKLTKDFQMAYPCNFMCTCGPLWKTLKIIRDRISSIHSKLKGNGCLWVVYKGSRTRYFKNNNQLFNNPP